MITKTARAISGHVAALIQPKAGSTMPRMELLQDSAIEDGAYMPPQALCVYSEDSIRALRDACNEALGEEVKP